MPEFVKPFSGMVTERKMTMGERIRVMRLDPAAERTKDRRKVAGPAAFELFPHNLREL